MKHLPSSEILDKPTFNGSYCKLSLYVRAETDFGQSIYVSGSSFSTGLHNPQNSIPLVTTPEEYPIWRTEKPIIIVQGIPHTYKYALFEGESFVKWEEIENPRRVIPEHEQIARHDVFGSFGGKNDLDKGKETIESTEENQEDTKDDSATIETETLPRKIKSGRLFLVCFHLPVQIFLDSTTPIAPNGQRIWRVSWSQSIIAKSDGYEIFSEEEKMEIFWIGTVSWSNDVLTDDDKQSIQAELHKMNCIPIFLPADLVKAHYYGYCKQIIWPIFHNVDPLDIATACWRSPELSPDQKWDLIVPEWWNAYQEVNEKFSDTVLELAREGDVIWIHDYHLMLMPKNFVEKSNNYQNRKIHMVFFLHIPFPTSQIFRTAVHGKLFLQGMLSADVVGFHAFDHARHFLNACKRLLGLSYQSREGGLLGVDFNGRTVMISMSHVGIEPKMLQKSLEDPAISALTEAIKAKHPQKIIIAGIDICQRLSGIVLKLLAFEKFLNEYPNWKKKVVLIQKCCLPSTREEDEQYTSRELREIIARINSTHGNVIDYEESHSTSVPLLQRLALWKVATIFLVTAVREGLNLLPLEFIFVHKDSDIPGVVLASEFSTCCSLLNGAIRLNPFDIDSVASIIDKTLNMSHEEAIGRRARDLPFITSRPAALWTRQVLLDMYTLINKTDVTDMEAIDLGTENVSHQISVEGFDFLNSEIVIERYRNSNRRIIFFNYEGTLLEKDKLSKYLKRDMSAFIFSQRPSQDVIQSLQLVCSDPKNIVFIITGLPKTTIEENIGHIKSLGLVAFNGLCYRYPSSPNQNSNEKENDWINSDYGIDMEKVIEIASPILETFTARTNGSSAEYRPRLAWNYFCTDPEWGKMQAKQLTIELEQALCAHDVTILQGQGILEVVPRRLHKGVIVKRILNEYNQRFQNVLSTSTDQHPDFILSIGVDSADEKMYSAIYSYIANLNLQVNSVFTCTVGKKPSHAFSYVNNVEDVELLINKLSQETISK